MTELERLLIEEINAKAENTFMFQLHENYVFDYDKFKKFIIDCDNLIAFYTINGKNDIYPQISAGIITVFEHTLMLLYSHLNEIDIYNITNYDEIKDNIPNYYMEIRRVTNKLLW